MSETGGAAELAARLHAAFCRSLWWSTDCRRPDGGRHGRTYRPAVTAALKGDDPATALHDRFCPAELSRNHASGAASGGCPDRERHVSHFARHLDITR